MHKYWKRRDYADAEKTKSFETLADIALRILDRMPSDAEMICGPITSGGLGSFKKNMAVFRKYVERARKLGLNIFDQLPFEKHLRRIWNETGCKNPEELLEKFYGKIFASGKLKRLYFIPGWRTSFGARWERKAARKFKIKIADIA